MIMPLDIQNKEFSKGVRGYKEEEVDRFLDIITVDYENLLQDVKVLKARVGELEDELERKRQLESSVKETLDATTNLMKEVSESAEKRAEVLIKNAEMEAELILKQARDEAQKYSDEVSDMKNRIAMFNDRFKNLLGSELDRFIGSVNDIEKLLQE